MFPPLNRSHINGLWKLLLTAAWMSKLNSGPLRANLILLSSVTGPTFNVTFLPGIQTGDFSFKSLPARTQRRESLNVGMTAGRSPFCQPSVFTVTPSSLAEKRGCSDARWCRRRESSTCPTFMTRWISCERRRPPAWTTRGWAERRTVLWHR